MGNGAYWIWHGGEPMLMGTEFYLKTYEYAREQMRIHKKLINFSMQSNILGYNKKWKQFIFNLGNIVCAICRFY